MSGLSIKKANRETSKKAKAQAKRARKIERRAAAKNITGKPGAAESISPLQNREGAMAGD